jgi:hypothetical protein
MYVRACACASLLVSVTSAACARHLHHPHPPPFVARSTLSASPSPACCCTPPVLADSFAAYSSSILHSLIRTIHPMDSCSVHAAESHCPAVVCHLWLTLLHALFFSVFSVLLSLLCFTGTFFARLFYWYFMFVLQLWWCSSVAVCCYASILRPISQVPLHMLHLSPSKSNSTPKVHRSCACPHILSDQPTFFFFSLISWVLLI